MSNCCKDCAFYDPITGANSFGSCSNGGVTRSTVAINNCSRFISKAFLKKKEPFRFALIRRLNELDKSQTWLAKQLSTDPSNVSLYVSGKRVPRANTFLRVCDILEIDPREVRFE